MKKIIVFFFFLWAIFISLYSLVFAQDAPENSASPSIILVDESDYKLPYPGMLPDHPLYKLKVLRDKILLYLTSDPLKKARLHLLMADKGLLSALKMAEKDKLPEAVHTAFKGEHQMTLLVNEVKRGVYAGYKLDGELVEKAHQAFEKHQQLLDGIMGRASEKDKENLEIIKEFSLRNNNQLLKLEKELREKPQNNFSQED